MKKHSLKLFLFFCAFLLQVNALFAHSVVEKGPVNDDIYLRFRSKTVSQKLPDKPIDKSIRVKVHTGYEYCYAPAFVDGESYVYIDNCSSSSAQFARYDVFQRVAWKIEDVWLCMTAPSSVTGIDGKATENWDYILLRPCVINDANQRWIIKNNAFYTADEKFRVKDYKWYAYISKTEGDYYNHTLSSTMDTWTKTIAAPGNISLKTSLGWKLASSSGFDMYYVSDNGSQTNVYDLYYNPENGHIARYFPSSGVLSCMISQQSSSNDWNWVDWRFCKDIVSPQKDIGYWDISILNGRDGPILDHQGNFLRVTRYGSNWGFPYTAKSSYLKGDTTHSPTSEFVLSYDIQRWNGYVRGNLGDSLAYCPAPGHKKTVVQSTKRLKRSLPSTFKLNEAWRKRLYDIATSTADTTFAAGACGPCMLQSLQMIAELQEYHSRNPLTSGGYFFDTAPNRDPMRSLIHRYPSVYNFLSDLPRHQGTPLHPGETNNDIAFRLVTTTAQTLLPRFEWRASNLATNRNDIRSAIQQLLAAEPGTMWIGFVAYTFPGGETGRHALPILRTSAGLKVIPTNTRMNFSQFVNDVSETTDPDLVLLRLAQRGNGTVVSFATVQLIGVAQEPLSVVISQNNCTGEGDDRRGSGQFPRSATVNQCASGRCAL
ncbi:DUF1561 family protein [Bartonella sp. A05]|uniref:DUF1561 family protein n=1 Tax=Bartonella sp. A05 TaxID=2967261 RepID=UPI0022A8DDE2|nr:DUF1561 family protein [Bartonella sp. A05]MCZ2203297.1 DUF1561 domain-containing protein [Bartonella sp. A05]